MKILSIEEFDDLNLVKDGWGSNYEGYKIITKEKEFVIAVDNDQSCCEDWGSITSADNLQDFIGANILDFRCIDNADYNEIELTKNHAGEYVDVYDCAFIDFETDKGKLQFAVYNHHNGYYGHDIVIQQNDINIL